MATSRDTLDAQGLLEDRVYQPIAIVGIVAVMASLAVGAVTGLYQGDFWAQEAAVRQADTVRRGVIASTGAWNPSLLFFGISMLMTSVAVVLLRVRKTIQARGEAMVDYLPALVARQGGE